MKIAVSGKGGVGKTLIAGGLAWHSALCGETTVAIDADPSPNLAIMLGLPAGTARAIVPLAENRSLIEARTSTGFSGVFRLSVPVDDIIRDYSIPTPSGVYLIVAGTVRSMGSGCNCPANALVRSLLAHLVLSPGQTVILDMEAGIEHLGRGTAEHVDAMLVITDAGSRSLSVAADILRLAREAGIPRVLLVGNRVAGERQREIIRSFAKSKGIPLLGIVPYDETVVEADMVEQSPLENRDSAAIREIGRLYDLLISRGVGGGPQ